MSDIKEDSQTENMKIMERYKDASPDLKRFYILFFIALSAAFAFLEYMIPKPLPMIRLGLANVVVILFIVYRYYRPAIIISIMRPILVSFIVGNIFSPPFWLALAGSCSACLIMTGTHYLLKRYISPIGLSLIGAFTHILAQLMMVYLLGILSTVKAIISIGSMMSIMALIGGLITGSIAIYLKEKL